jgi:hypothetical protein
MDVSCPYRLCHARADEIELDGKWWVPACHVFGVADARNVGRQGGIGGERLHLHDRGDFECRRSANQIIVGSNQKVGELEGVSQLRVQVASSPGIQGDLSCIKLVDGSAGADENFADHIGYRGCQCRHRRVGQQLITDYHAIGQIGQVRPGSGSILLCQPKNRFRNGGSEQELLALHCEIVCSRTELQTQILQMQTIAERLFETAAPEVDIVAGRGSSHQEYVDLVRSVETVLQGGEIDERIQGACLAGLQAEPSRSGGWNDPRDRESQSGQDVALLAASHQAGSRHLGRAAKGQQDVVTLGGPQLPPQGLVDHHRWENLTG